MLTIPKMLSGEHPTKDETGHFGDMKIRVLTRNICTLKGERTWNRQRIYFYAGFSTCKSPVLGCQYLWIYGQIRFAALPRCKNGGHLACDSLSTILNNHAEYQDEILFLERFVNSHHLGRKPPGKMGSHHGDNINIITQAVIKCLFHVA